MLVGSLLEQARGDDEAHVLTVDQDLSEAFVDAADAVGHMLEATTVEDGFLHTGYEAEFQVFGDFTDLAQDGQIEHQFVVAARLQVFEEFVHHEQQPLVREFLAERGHHLLEGILVVQFLIRRWEGEIHTELLEEAFELLGDDLAQRHFQPADFDAQHLELPSDGGDRIHDLGVADHRRVGCVLGHQRQHRHQVRLTGAVVADDEHALVIDRFVEAELGHHQLGDALGHVVGDDEGGDELLGFVRAVGIEQLDDGFDLLELNQVFVFHVLVPCWPCAVSKTTTPSRE
ncbi:hypothetical protein D3C87_1301210 [compost metagenome]